MSAVKAMPRSVLGVSRKYVLDVTVNNFFTESGLPLWKLMNGSSTKHNKWKNDSKRYDKDDDAEDPDHQLDCDFIVRYDPKSFDVVNCKQYLARKVEGCSSLDERSDKILSAFEEAFKRYAAKKLQQGRKRNAAKTKDGPNKRVRAARQ